MIQDTVPISLLVRTNTHSFSQDERKRREGALKNKDFFYGRQEQYLSLLNEDMDPVTVNLTNPIVNKRASLLYSRPLVRILDGPSVSISTIEEIYSYLKIDYILQQIDLAAELTGSCVVYIGLNENGEIVLVPYDASNFSAVTQEDKTTLEALDLITINDVVTNINANIDVKRVIDSEVWTDEYIYRLRDGLQRESIPNELGYIPFVIFKAQEVMNQYLGHSPAISIRQLNSYLNQQLTNLGYMVKMQAGTPVVLNGFQSGESVSVHPGTAISLPAGTSAGVLQTNPKLMEVLEVIKYLEEKTYQTSSVPKISIYGDSAGSTSGVELLIKWAPILNVFKEKTTRYQRYELNLANMILRTLGLEPLDDIKINYPEEDILPVDTDRENLEQDISLGIRTPVDEVIKLNSNLDETEAIDLVLSNLQFNKNLSGGLDAREQS